MEPMNSEVVRESAIFAALSPRGYPRRERPAVNLDVQSSSPGDDGAKPSGSLPPVNPRDANRIQQLVSPQRTKASSLLINTPQSLMMAVPMTTTECWVVWKFLCDWVKTQLAMEVPASILGFGTFYLRVQPLGIRITLFEPDKQFLNKFALQTDSEIADPALVAALHPTVSNLDTLTSTGGRGRAASVIGLGNVFAFSFVEMAACCGNAVDAARAQDWLSVIVHKLGTAMSQRGRVELNIGVGVIVCVDRVIQRHLLLRDSHAPPRLEYEIRTGESVVKRNLRVQAALQTTHSPKTKSSFLSGPTFSSSIQLNPVVDRSQDVPDFSFGFSNPRPPAFTSVVATSNSRPSPRSTQLQRRNQRSPSPLQVGINASLKTAHDTSDEWQARHSTPTTPKQTEENWTPPQLFDRLSRTLCVEPDQNVSFLLPSNRIGSNYTATAALLMTEKSASQFGQLTSLNGGLVFFDKPNFTHRQLERKRKDMNDNSLSEQRYFEYLSDDKLIDRCYLSPLPSDLEARVVTAAVKYIVGPSGDHIEEVMETAHQDFIDNYYSSAKKSILNYLLIRKSSCERLGIPHGVPIHVILPTKWKWGSSDGPNGCLSDLEALVSRRGHQLTKFKRARNTTGQPSKAAHRSFSETMHSKITSRKRLQSKLMSLLVLANPQVRALRYMWHDLNASVMLVDLPSIEGLNEPMDIIEFERAQLAYSAKMKTFMMENWYVKTKLMFESAIQAETFSIRTSEAAVSFRLRHLFDTVVAVMSLQIRSLIMKSIQAYVKFFELFGEITEDEQANDSNQQVQEAPRLSGLLTMLVLNDGQIEFRDPLVDIPSRLLNVLHNIPKMFHNLGRIETQFEEPLVLPSTTSPFLWNVASQEDDIVVATIRIRSIIEHNLVFLRKLQSEYDGFALTHRYVHSVDCFHLEENGELETYRGEMERVQTTAMQLAIDNRHSQNLGLFSVDCRLVNTTLHTELAQWTIRLLQAFEQRTGRMNAELRQQYKEIAARLAKKPLDLYELVDAEAFIQSLKTSKLQELHEHGNTIKQRLRFLLFERENTHIGNIASDSLSDAQVSDLEYGDSFESGFRLSVDLLSSTAKTVKWRSHIDKRLKEAESLLVNERARIEAMFIAKRSRFQAEIEEFEVEVRGFAKKGDLRHAATYVVQLAKMKDNMFIFLQAMDTIVKEEQKLQWKPTDFSKLDDIAEEMAPYEQLWKTVREFREMNSQWLRGNVFELPGNEGMQTLQQMLAVIASVSSVLLLNSAAAAITAETVRKQMTDFRENVRLIVAIQNPAMKERHMKAVSNLIGLNFGAEEAITLLKLLENGAFEMVNDIVDISCNATQEQQIERALNEMGEEWESTSFDLVPSQYPFTSVAVLAPIMTSGDSELGSLNVVLGEACADRIVALMDDHLLRLQTLSCMSHADPFIEDIALWQEFAAEIGKIVEMLTLIEQLWQKLTPLFAAGIVETDSNASELFGKAAQLYRSIHSTLLQTPVCTSFFQRTSPAKDLNGTQTLPTKALLSDLEQCQVLLETVRGNVRVGFKTKRSSFARFYFLSDAELVTALALARVPGDATLWKAMSRCFPGIHSVVTNPANEITGLLSSLGEPFPLGSPIVTADTPMPIWLAKFETSMTTILHASIRAACSDLPRKEFRKWCLIWPEQSLLVAIQLVWTLESEQAYQNLNQRKAWTVLTNSLHFNIESVTKEMKVAVYPHLRATLCNVLLLLIQLRDVSCHVLEKEIGGMWVDESSDSSDEMRRSSLQSLQPRYSPSLTWIAQPRFYFVDSVLSVTMMTSSYLPYGFEYLGNGSTGILVTPLTMRCYHAIAQTASTLNRGVCLVGGAGTGKSAICQQLARLCGRLCATFQCANRKLVLEDVMNFVKATASSGAWLCLDNFQLIGLTNTSLVTMMCAQVMTSLAAKHAQCNLLGDKIRLKRGALFLFTLTTRQQLNSAALRDERFVQATKYLFRTVVVQSPDIEKLAEYLLQCGQFVHASALAKLIAVALTTFERGFELMSNPDATTDELKAFEPYLGNLRMAKSIVKRAIELNSTEKEYCKRTRQRILITPDLDENEEGLAVYMDEPLSIDPTAEAIEKHDEEQMEHRNVYLALREKLGSVVPSANLYLLDSMMRDLNPLLLAREFHQSKSVLRTPRTLLGSSRQSGVPPRRSIEDDVESYVRTAESSWKRFGVEFGLKTVQLLQIMRSSRVVVVSGEMQAGKTSLYNSLARALTHISKSRTENRQSTRPLTYCEPGRESSVVAPTRCVVLCPRALQLGQLLDLGAEDHSHCVFYRLVKEAKAFFKTDKSTQTWLVFDGDLDELWSEQIIHTVEELQDDFPGYRRGLQVASGKYFNVPPCVRIVIETTTLANATPSFMTRVGSVHMAGNHTNSNGQGWENLYKVWKMLTKADFEGFADFIFSILDAVVTEVVTATLQFVATNFRGCYGEGVGVLRVQWALKMFASALQQSWIKFVALTSDKQRSTAIHCLFLQALVWGVGSTCDALERQKFNLFLYDLILRGPNNEQSTLKRLITLFFPNNALAGNVADNISGEKVGNTSGVGGGGPGPRAKTIYDYGFSLDFGSKWLPWTEFYSRWVQALLGSAVSNPGTENGDEFNIVIGSQLNRLLVPTGAMSAAICLSSQLLLARIPAVLIGPKDCGKTVCGSALILLNAVSSQRQIKVGAALPETKLHQLEPGNTDAHTTDAAVSTEERLFAERVYAGYYTRASEVLLHFESALQKIRIDHQDRSKREQSGTSIADNENRCSQSSQQTVHIFVDDLNCFNPGHKMDSALELLRMLTEYEAVIDPSTNLLTPCSGFLLFGTLHVTPNRHATVSHDHERLERRLVPVALQPFSDADLTTICENVSSPALQLHRVLDGSTPNPTLGSTTGASGVVVSKEPEQRQALIIKASLKLYRLLTSNTDFSIFSKEATLDPIKLHYNYRTAQLIQIVKCICCEICPPMLLIEKPALARLWCHESTRILGDCIMDAKELNACHRRVIDIGLTTFGVTEKAFFPSSFDSVALQNKTLTQNWFANDLYFSFIGDTNAGGAYRNGYHEVNETGKLELAIERSMMSADSNSPDSMELILCSYVIEQVLRITRLIRMGSKSMLLLGARGRKLVMITRLACIICKRVSMVYQIPALMWTPKDGELTTTKKDEHAAYCKKWNAALRSAMVNSVRSHDTPTVFIVKDIHLHSEAYPYRMIDLFLGGHNMPSEIISHEDLDDEVIAILRENAQQERKPPSITRTGSHNSGTAHHQAPSVLRSKSAILEHFFQYVRQKLQLVLILSPQVIIGASSACWARILWRYPNILKCSDINYATEWSSDALVTIARKCLAQTTSNIDKQSDLQVAEAAAQVYEATRHFLQTQCKSESSACQKQNVDETDPSAPSRNTVPFSFVVIEPGMLVDHLGLFTSRAEQLQHSVIASVSKFKSGLAFVDQTAQILETERNQAGLLLPEVLEKTEVRRRMSGSLEREKIASNKVVRGFEMAAAEVATQRERLVVVTQEYNDLIKGSRDTFEKMRNTLRIYHEAFDQDVDDSGETDDEHFIDESADGGEDLVVENAGETLKVAQTENTIATTGSLDEVDMDMVRRCRRRRFVRKFTLLSRIPSSIYQLSECLGVLLGIEPVEGHDDMDPDEVIMNYWENIATQMATAAFWKALMMFDVPSQVTEKMVSVLLPICRSPDFDQDLFTSVHEIAGVLCQWVQTCTAYARDFILAMPKHAQLMREQELLKQAEAQVVKSKMEIQDQTTSSLQTSELRDRSEIERQRAEEKLQDTTSLLHLTNAAWKVLSSTRERWKQKYIAYTHFAEHWKGDLLLATAVIAYASCLIRPTRLALYEKWMEAIASSSVVASPVRRPLHGVLQIRETELTKMRLNGLLPNDECTLENAVIALHSYRFPFLVDPYGVALDWLKRQLGSYKLTIASASNTTSDAAVWKEVETSIKRDSALILTDVSKERMESLRSFLEAKRKALFEAIKHEISYSVGGYRCWCYKPDDIADSGATSVMTKGKDSIRHVEAPIFRFTSDSCRVFLIYTDTNTLPRWLAAYQSQVSIVRFDLTAAFVGSQALQKLLESQGHLRELTEIRTLQQEILICDEQIYGLEEELLEFFTTETAELVYSENSKALRIVANRSSVSTLQNTRAEADIKVSRRWNSLARYRAVAKRCLDAVWAWREFEFVVRDTDNTPEKPFALALVWQLLTRAGESNKTDNNLEVVMASFTSYLQQYITMNLHDEDRLLFRFLLALRVWQRRMMDENPSTQAESGALSRPSTDMDLLSRLLALVSSKSDRNSHDTCRPSLKSLLALRPIGMKSISWSAICYLAEASGTLRQFITRLEGLETGQLVWKGLMELGTSSSVSWDVPIPLDSFTRLCIVIAVHPHRFLCELEDFARTELQRVYTIPVASSTSSIMPVPDTNKPSLPTVVATAAHSAMTQAPGRQHDLFYIWQSFSSAKAPIVVLCPPSINFMDAVANVARRAGATMDTIDTIQLLLTDEPTFKTMLLLAMEKSQWVVFPNTHTYYGRMEQVNSVYESLEDGQVHSDFRLWISVSNNSVGDQESWQAAFENMKINQFATQRKWGTGFVSLKRSLHHTFAIMKQELEDFTFSSTMLMFSTVTSASSAVLSEHEEKILKQLGVFHALISCRDHFGFAQWKTQEAFGDTELCAAIRSLVVLRTDERTAMKEQPNPLCALELGMWTEVTLRGVIMNVYGSTLEARQDQLLLETCINFVLRTWPDLLDEVELDTAAIIGHMTIPEAVVTINKLAPIPWMSIVSSIPHLWISESCGPPVLKEAVTVSGTPLDNISIWDPQNVRKNRQRKTISQLSVLIEGRGHQLHSRILPGRSAHKMELITLLEVLSGFAKNLEDVIMPVTLGERYEYHKPISALVYHEIRTLDRIRSMIVGDIRNLETVSVRGRPLDVATQQIYEELQRNEAPRKWLKFLRLHGSEPEKWTLYIFQKVLLDRLNTFAAWAEPEKSQHKLPLDKFLGIKYVFEAVHQHFIRNHVGSALCSPNCLKIASIFEDSPKLTLPAKEDAVYFSGLRAMGHLQLQIVDARGHFRRPPVSPDGVPIILQITSSCLSKVHGVSVLTKGITSVIREATAEDEQTKATQKEPVEFLCPLFTNSRRSGNARCAETSIRLVSIVPTAQLILSGASLQVQTIE